MTARVAIYTRVSTDEQARPDAVSLEDQERRGRDQASAKGWPVVGVFSDPGVSGNSRLAERPGGQALLAAIERGEITNVVVWDMSRWTRSAAKGLADFDTLAAKGVEVLMVKESIDTSTSTGRLFRTILAAMAEWERETIAERTTAGRRGAAEAGRWPGSRVPFGYEVDENGQVIEDPERADIVRRIFAARAKGHTLPEIADRLNAEGLRMRPKGKRIDGEMFDVEADFTTGSLAHIVKQAAYMGGADALSVKVDDRDFTFEAPALVDPTTWKLAQGTRQGRKTNITVGGKRGSYALGDGRVKHDHGDTLATMFGQWRTVKSGKLRLYRCLESRTEKVTDAKTGKVTEMSPTCTGVGQSWGKMATAVPADILEARFALWAIKLIGDPVRFAEYAAAADQALLAEEGDPADLEAQRERLAALKSKRAIYVDMFAEGRYTREELDVRLERLDAEADILAGAIERATEIEAQRETIGLTLKSLMSGPVIADGGEDETLDPNLYPPSFAQELEDLRRAASRTLSEVDENGRPIMLTEASINLVAQLAARLGVLVIVSEGPEGNPDRPNIRVKFNPAAVLQVAAVSGRSSQPLARFDFAGKGPSVVVRLGWDGSEEIAQVVNLSSPAIEEEEEAAA